jgi:hypothetical protein
MTMLILHMAPIVPLDPSSLMSSADEGRVVRVFVYPSRDAMVARMKSVLDAKAAIRAADLRAADQAEVDAQLLGVFTASSCANLDALTLSDFSESSACLAARACRHANTGVRRITTCVLGDAALLRTMLRWRSVEAIRLLQQFGVYSEEDCAAAAANPDPRVWEHVRYHGRIKDASAAAYMEGALDASSTVTWKEIQERLGLPPLSHSEAMLRDFRESDFRPEGGDASTKWEEQFIVRVPEPSAFDPYPLSTVFLTHTLPAERVALMQARLA